MEQSEKKTNSSFLDKFRGRTSKVDKSGLANALTSEKTIPIQQKKEVTYRHRPRRLTSLDPHLNEPDRIKVEQEQLHLRSPQRRILRPILTKRGTNPSILNKEDPLPLLYSPLVPLKDVRHKMPPSRSTSDKSEKQDGRSFGKYLKLDDDARRHFQFLLQMDRGKGRRASLTES